MSVRFSIHSDGSLSHLGVLSSSGHAESGETVLHAVERANPLELLSIGVPPIVDAAFFFDIEIEIYSEAGDL